MRRKFSTYQSPLSGTVGSALGLGRGSAVRTAPGNNAAPSGLLQ